MEFTYLKWEESRHGSQLSTFEKLLDLFQQILQYTAGDVAEALDWLNQLDQKYGLTDAEMGMGDFIEQLKQQGYIDFDEQNQVYQLTPKSEQGLRKRALESLFGKLKKSTSGNHKTVHTGNGDERQPETRPFSFGDDIYQLDVTGTLANAYRRSGIEAWSLHQDDFQVFETDHQSSVATVLMIDLSHSMVLYGEDRITPARQTAMALAALIKTKYPKDSLDIVAFGNEAWEVQIKDLPYLNVGPFHTNTRAGLQRARTILHRRKASNKQIFMITDGKPSCHFEYGRLYKNSFGLDRKIVNKVLDEAALCRREGILITTFMIAQDPYLQQFVRQLTETNRGKAYYANLDNLGDFIFEDFERNRRKKMR